MSTLLLRLAGPMQSWGTDSRFDLRFTGREPSKSGVIGLLCAALGKPRQERSGDGHPPLAELAALRMGVRVEREGEPRVDYQTAGGGTLPGGAPYGVVQADGKRGDTVQSWRYYLAEADFLVGLEGDEALLRQLDDALRRPVWQLCLGRKSYLPSEPVRLPDHAPLGPSLRLGLALEEALYNYPPPAESEPLRGLARPSWQMVRAGAQRTIIETRPGERRPGDEARQDVPLDFATRRFGLRYVRVA